MSLDHIHPDFRAIMSRSDNERMTFLREPRWISYAAAEVLLKTLRGLMEMPSRPRMPCLLVVGDSNNGKTTIVRRFVHVHGQAYISPDIENVAPVVLAEAPPAADERALYAAILDRFYCPYRVSHPVHVLRDQVVRMMRLCRTRILLIDEFHSLMSGPAARQREVMNAIKRLCNELAIPVVGIGTQDAVQVLHQDPQHASRFRVFSLPLWELNKDFRQRLQGIERVLPLRKPSNLTDLELGMALHAISHGNLGNLHELIMECALEAITSGKEQIDKDIIAGKAWMAKPIRTMFP